jgi:hypothetical protein
MKLDNTDETLCFMQLRRTTNAPYNLFNCISSTRPVLHLSNEFAAACTGSLLCYFSTLSDTHLCAFSESFFILDGRRPLYNQLPFLRKWDLKKEEFLFDVPTHFRMGITRKAYIQQWVQILMRPHRTADGHLREIYIDDYEDAINSWISCFLPLFILHLLAFHFIIL